MTVLAASDYPFLSILATIVVFMAMVIGVWLVIAVLINVFLRRDISGWGKAAWAVALIVVPFVGALVYLIRNHDEMAQRGGAEAAASQAELDDYVRETTGTAGPAAEIETAKNLLDSGTITQAEFDVIKENSLGSATVASV
jgi:hypothetical protein